MSQEELDYDEYLQAQKDMNAEALDFDQWEEFNKYSSEPKFHDQNLDEEVNIPNILKELEKDQLVGLVDESIGGIIGYINREYIDRVLNILNNKN